MKECLCIHLFRVNTQKTHQWSHNGLGSNYFFCIGIFVLFLSVSIRFLTISIATNLILFENMLWKSSKARIQNTTSKNLWSTKNLHFCGHCHFDIQFVNWFPNEWWVHPVNNMDEVIIHLKSVNKLSIKIGLIFYMIIYLVLHNKHEIRTSCMFILALFYEGIYNSYKKMNTKVVNFLYSLPNWQISILT